MRTIRSASGSNIFIFSPFIPCLSLKAYQCSFNLFSNVSFAAATSISFLLSQEIFVSPTLPSILSSDILSPLYFSVIYQYSQHYGYKYNQQSYTHYNFVNFVIFHSFFCCLLQYFRLSYIIFVTRTTGHASFVRILWL